MCVIMSELFNKTFFTFVLGFLGILFASFVVMALVGLSEDGVEATQQNNQEAHIEHSQPL